MLSRLALGGALDARRARRSASTSSGPSSRSRRPAASGPQGWYCRYGPSVNTRELLVEEGGFVYDSDAYNDDLPYYTEVKGKRHLVVPYTLTYNDGRYVLPQGFSDPTSSSTTAGAASTTSGTRAPTHPQHDVDRPPLPLGRTGRPHRALREFIEYAMEKGDVWFVRRIDVAHWWNEHSDSFPMERA